MTCTQSTCTNPLASLDPRVTAPGAEASILKIKGSEIHQGLAELLLHAAGPGADPNVAARYFNLRKLSIYGGTNEVQRNIVAKASLGL